MLAAEGISARVIDMFTWKPIDEALIEESAARPARSSPQRTTTISPTWAAQVAEVVTSTYPVPVMRVGVEDEFGEVGPEDYLRKRFELTADQGLCQGKGCNRHEEIKRETCKSARRYHESPIVRSAQWGLFVTYRQIMRPCGA